MQVHLVIKDQFFILDDKDLRVIEIAIYMLRLLK